MQIDENAYRNIDEAKKEKPKICPILAQGWLSNPKIAETEFDIGSNGREGIHTWNPDRLPKCLQEGCALWKTYSRFCGLKTF
jgi:hypothetical protein